MAVIDVLTSLNPTNLPTTSLVGYLAATLTTVSFVPQAYRTLKTRDTEGLSVSMYAIFTSGVACWLLYGLVQQDTPMIVANSITLLLSSIILLTTLLQRSKILK